jgi:hypothetical protein
VHPPASASPPGGGLDIARGSGFAGELAAHQGQIAGLHAVVVVVFTAEGGAEEAERGGG